MESKKKDLEIICNLQWKNQAATANGGDKSNIIGMYDIPCTTLNWDVFKSYLLKNSGTDLDDVKVYYVTSNDREFLIESQTDFQIALYAFRRKARNNEIINLKLDRVTNKAEAKAKNRSIDVETQSDTLDSSPTNMQSFDMADVPPAWFTHFMAQFKQEVMADVKTSMTEVVANLQTPEPQQAPVQQPQFPPPLVDSYNWRKCKSDAKRVRKSALPPSLANRQQNERELIKSVKLERKLESKLEKLENKTKKLREKKLALFSKSTSDSDGGPTCSNKRFDRKRNYPTPTPIASSANDKQLEEAAKCEQEPVYEMDAKVLTKERPMFFLGGEVFCWTWLVQNTGTKPWTIDTNAIFTWGSKALQPCQYTIACPRLKPGETGKIINLLEIPLQKGKYECYYHFHHKNRRFGQCLSCQIYVDPMGRHEAYNAEEELEKVKVIKTALLAADNCTPSTSATSEEKPVTEYPYDMEQLKTNLVLFEGTKGTVNAEMKKEHDNYCTTDSDNQSDGSESDEGFRDEFVVVPVPDCFKLDVAVNRVDYAKLLKEAYETAQEQQPGPSTKPPQSNCYRVDSVDLFVDWPKPAVEETLAQEEAAEAVENFDDNNNTASRSPSVCGLADSDVGSNQSDTVVIVRNNTEDGYAYVEVNGKGLNVPRKLLKTEYIDQLDANDKSKTPSTLSIASSSVVVINDDDDTQTEQNIVEDISEPLVEPQQPSEPANVPTTQLISLQTEQQNNFPPSAPVPSSNEAAATEPLNVSTSFKGYSRTFVFPQNNPGFEVNADPAEVVRSLNNPFSPVPNYQQTPPALRLAPDPQVMRMFHHEQEQQLGAESSQQQQQHNTVHILPETLVSGAVNVASSALNTARSVINMIVPPRPQWVADEWSSSNPDRRVHEENLRALAEMGFWDQDLNVALLVRHKGDLSRVITELVQ